MVKTAILVSGGGTNLQAIIDAHARGDIKNCELAAVISSKPDAYALTRAELAGISTYVIDRKQYADSTGFSADIHKLLTKLDIELVALAGFMYVLDAPLVNAFENRIINIHPALIPAFCGVGFYGLRVHERVLEYGVKITGATAHFCTAGADEGPIILQQSVEVREDDTPQSLQRRVMEEAEWHILPRAISLYCERRLEVEGRRVRIRGEL
ncbi:MAG: phosphoribosylglycinamide formyltransferase [Oscillospiraceae bacterium]|jgi:phosphoribosylglycinamide formyltransferase-1|nr:phosphoribosylglycinamide formyltransferase [Oscillospiraceae bacterium]